MKSPATKYFLVLLFCAIATSTRAQNGFQNLDFEDATVPQTQSSGLISVTDALPFWSVFTGTTQLSEVLFNAETGGTTSISLLGINFGRIEGGYSVLLQGYTTAADASISQTAVVPTSAQSIVFKARPDTIPGTLVVSLGSQSIQLLSLGSGPNYTLYGGDIPITFAGQTETLKFSAPESFTGPNDWEIDSIAFSPNALPEPQIYTLLLCAAAALALRAGLFFRPSLIHRPQKT